MSYVKFTTIMTGDSELAHSLYALFGNGDILKWGDAEIQYQEDPDSERGLDRFKIKTAKGEYWFYLNNFSMEIDDDNCLFLDNLANCIEYALEQENYNPFKK